jgi:hypothetical protein
MELLISCTSSKGLIVAGRSPVAQTLDFLLYFLIVGIQPDGLPDLVVMRDV